METPAAQVPLTVPLVLVVTVEQEVVAEREALAVLETLEMEELEFRRRLLELLRGTEVVAQEAMAPRVQPVMVDPPELTPHPIVEVEVLTATS